jgi:hypothetical protein
MLRRKRKGSKPDTEGEPATEPPSPRPRAVTTDSGLLARAMVRESTKRDEQRTGGGTDDEREDRDGSKKKGGRMMDLKELVSQTKKNFKGGSGTLSLRWTATKKKSSIASSLSSSDLRVHSSSAGEELSSDSDSPESPANGLNARPRTERKKSKLTTDEGEDLFDGFRERPMSSRGTRSASSGHEYMGVEVGSNEGKGSLKARKAKPHKLLTDRPAKRSELGDGADQELCGNDRAIASLQLLPVEVRTTALIVCANSFLPKFTYLSLSVCVCVCVCVSHRPSKASEHAVPRYQAPNTVCRQHQFLRHSTCRSSPRRPCPWGSSASSQRPSRRRSSSP